MVLQCTLSCERPVFSSKIFLLWFCFQKPIRFRIKLCVQNWIFGQQHIAKHRTNIQADEGFRSKMHENKKRTIPDKRLNSFLLHCLVTDLALISDLPTSLSKKSRISILNSNYPAFSTPVSSASIHVLTMRPRHASV